MKKSDRRNNSPFLVKNRDLLHKVALIYSLLRKNYRGVVIGTVLRISLVVSDEPLRGVKMFSEFNPIFHFKFLINFTIVGFDRMQGHSQLGCDFLVG